MSVLEIREQIFQDNPFFSGIAADPWDNTDPDVPSLNREAYRHLRELVLAKSRNPCAALAGLVLGEAGMGKTYLLKRLLRYVRRHGIETVFVSVHPLPDSGRPMRHLLREIVFGLSGKGIYEGRRTKPLTRQRVTQFDYLADKIVTACRKDERESSRDAARFLNRGGEKPAEKPSALLFSFLFSFLSSSVSFLSRVFGRAKQRDGAAFLRGRCRGVHPRLIGAVFACSDPRKREEALDWLENGVQNEREEDAREILVSFGTLLEYCGVSMIVCFDQLDGMREESLITAFGDIVHFLVNDVKGILPLAFVRMNTWSARFSRLDPAVTQRLSGNRMVLYACTLEQARELIKVRLESRFKSDCEEKFRWLMDRLEGKLKAGYSPRAVIELANREIVRGDGETQRAGEPSGVSEPAGLSKLRELAESFSTDSPAAAVLDTFAAEYRRERGRADAEFAKRAPDAESLVRALETCLFAHPGFRDIRRSPDKYVPLTGRREGGGPCAFIVSVGKNHRAVGTALTRGLSFLRDNPGGECFYVSDGRCDFRDREQWKAVNGELKKFEEAKGVLLFLDRDQATAWYALAELRLEVDREDVALPASGEKKRAARLEDLLLFLREGLAGPQILHPLLRTNPRPPIAAS
jgi:Cdc6-like AAA superfamily ATPase